MTARTGRRPLSAATRRAVARVFRHLDYRRLGTIYCDEGGAAFWRARRAPCQRLGLALAAILRNRLMPGGRTLCVGAGVAELPVLAMERLELQRDVSAYNLREAEVQVLNEACQAAAVPLAIRGADAAEASGPFDHLWLVSVLNDPERYPQLAALSYGRADPTRFDPEVFAKERRVVRRLVDRCLRKLRCPALVTTSVEEIPWITEGCARQGLACVVEPEDYPTAIVEDPVCLIRLEGGRSRGDR